ncbi:MAG: VCBS repeat-containing protein [Planctomycetia bacterium]|nr:VCBS repeat-containing protein [Planctomycetia bacterium]
MPRFLPALLIALVAISGGLCPPLAEAVDPPSSTKITWKKTVLDRKFRSEGVAVADVNKDGKIDVLNGEYWYEAPDWTPHELQPFKDHKDGLGNYSRVFFCWAEDLNVDSWPDLIVIDFPGAPCYWMENPKGKSRGDDGKPLHWQQHRIWHSACNETPIYTDLLGNGKRVLVMGFQPQGKETEGQMAYFTPDPKNPTGLWIMHPISEPSVPGKEIPGTRKFSHGLGAGDINGDGRADVMCTGGWWEQPEKPDGKTPWKFTAANFGAACADMFAFDVDGNGLNDVISTSAHQFGIWFHRQNVDKKKQTTWTTVTLFGMLVSETHAAHFVDIDGDGVKDLVTGKRWWSHGRSEPGANWSAPVYYFKATKNADKVTSFFPVLIDDDCGIGTQFAVDDINGDKFPDIIVSNKKGVRVVVQERK